MPSNFRSFLDFGPSLVLSGMLRRVPSRLSVTFFVMCITSRLWGVWRTFQYGRAQKTDLAFHTPRSGFALVASSLALGTNPNYSEAPRFLRRSSYAGIFRARLYH